MLISRFPKKFNKSHLISTIYNLPSIFRSPTTNTIYPQKLNHFQFKPITGQQYSFSTTTTPTPLSEYEYRTIESSLTEPVLLKEKGSKFLCYAHQINNEIELKEALDSIKSQHPRATHHCYAYRIGPKGENYRANDDGEPSGSAGLPILGQIQSYDITNVLLTVVRYYGGTKLGVSGLIQAYKNNAKMALEESNIIVKELEIDIEIQYNDFQTQNSIFNLLGRFNAQIQEFQTADGNGDDDDEDMNMISAKIQLQQKDQILGLMNELNGVTVKVINI